SVVTATVDGMPEWSLEYADEDAARRTWQFLTEVVAATERAAHTDRLTGLPNRAGLETELARLADQGARYGLLMVDLNGFKLVNDMFGHAAGDAVLAAVGARLAELTRDGGFAARLGGDEFVLITAAHCAWELGYEVCHKVADPVMLTGG